MTPVDDIEDSDPGFARERTHLAWTRTAISFAALGGAILKSRPLEGIPILALSVLVWELGRLPRASGTRLAQARRLLLITVAITGISLAALILSFLGHGSGGLLIKHQ
jgi:uncharacterized membrane protein YidH (DUF202 family)